MKVCTDACLFGAWTADWLVENKPDVKKILDVGAGTGLLSLQLAQNLPNTTIDAVEINTEAAFQAKDNFKKSLWKERLRLHNSSIQDFFPDKKYQFIISNPPFYNNDLKGNNIDRNTAHHSSELSLHELIKAIERLLEDDGYFALLLPYHRTKECENIALAEGFFVNKISSVKQTEQHNFFRSMLLFSKENKVVEKDEIFIKDTLGNYSKDVINLLKDYYLYL